MWGGIPQFDPKRRLRDAKAKGLKLIVIDPRRTEAAANAEAGSVAVSVAVSTHVAPSAIRLPDTVSARSSRAVATPAQ